jgi:taspase (threonine aspartase 1)
MTRACRAAAAALDAGAGALAAAEAAVASLEDGELANAGRGSNLTAAGRVECDAAAMDGDGAFGAVGAAPGVRNPVAAAAALARDSRVPLSHGRVRPMLLCGDGARAWARARGLEAAATPAAAEAVHVTERAQRQWRKYTDKVVFI